MQPDRNTYLMLTGVQLYECGCRLHMLSLLAMQTRGRRLLQCIVTLYSYRNT